MKTLEERQKERKIRRGIEEQATKGKNASVVSDEALAAIGGGQTDGEGEGTGDQFESMTIANMRDWAKEKGAEIPKEITKADDIRTWVRNADELLANDPNAFKGTGSATWNSGN